jgi:hypothetical protein
VSGYRIEVPFVPESLNRVLRWHPQRKKREREMWEKAIFVVLGRVPVKNLREAAGRHQRLRVCVTICNPRRYDNDNAHGACKIVFDAIRNLALARDDNDEFMDQQVKQEPATRKTKHTVIEITPQIGSYAQERASS